MPLTLEQANTIISAGFDMAKALGLKPVCIAVLDPGGHVVSLQRQDGASNLRPQMATGKASSALALGMSSRRIGEMAQERPSLIASLGPISQAGMIPAAGGVLVAGPDGALLGAVGVTGDTSDNDEKCAIAGVEAAGLAVRA
ncbi:MAG: heme-binding protein [Alphaproteobacteria bacterium]|nr:heme-binding protein [Alphaproteobacteria bacterium]